jgi:hypothetical protein
VVSPALGNRFVDHPWSSEFFLMFVAEQGTGQGPSSQPRSCSLNLEEAQHTLSSSLPLIYLRIFCCSATTLLHARYALYDHEASPKGYASAPTSCKGILGLCEPCITIRPGSAIANRHLTACNCLRRNRQGNNFFLVTTYIRLVPSTMLDDTVGALQLLR